MSYAQYANVQFLNYINILAAKSGISGIAVHRTTNPTAYSETWTFMCPACNAMQTTTVSCVSSKADISYENTVTEALLEFGYQHEHDKFKKHYHDNGELSSTKASAKQFSKETLAKLEITKTADGFTAYNQSTETVHFAPTAKELEKVVTTYYDKAFVQNLKANTSWGQTKTNFGQSIAPAVMPNKEKPWSTKVVINQELIMEVAKAGNFNVNLQQRYVGPTYEYRALCGNCEAEIQIDMPNITRGGSKDELLAFCESHRHIDNVVVESTGRRFKDL